MKGNPAVLLDRDGVINIPQIINHKSYAPRFFSDFKLYNHTNEALLLLKNMGFLLIVITNQPDISNGLMKTEELNLMNEFLLKTTPIDHIYVCPHSKKDNCNCRKPNPGMIISAINDFKLDINLCWIIGDRWSDIYAGKKMGVKGVFINRNYKETKIDQIDVPKVSNLLSAVNLILTYKA